MKNILKNRRALSTVVTTLIILVVSVLLAGVVTYFAINVVSTRVQDESLNLQYQHVWFSTTDNKAEAAIMITNTGGRDVVLQNIAVRGQTIPASEVFYFTVTTIGDLPYYSQANTISTTNTTVPTGFGASGDFKQATTITLTSGSTIAVYMFAATTAPGSVTVNDVGLTIAISVFSAQATYIKETNVNAA
ncbi:MAG: type IV pilin [Candidatus Bathyarchaeia archaeon]